MKTGTSLRNRQGGAVAVMVGISIVLLVGFLALVIDLGHLYIAKTELQNAADAAALSGAKQLDGTYSACCDTANPNSAVSRAIDTAGRNPYDFAGRVVITIADIRLGTCPEDSCMVSASSISDDTSAASRLFIEVRTGANVPSLEAWFARIWDIFQTRTFGLAVAGYEQIEMAPIAVCPIDKTRCPPGGTDCGFLKGLTYRLSDLNPIGPGTMYWIDANATSPTSGGSASCDGSTTRNLPYMCTGKVNFTPVLKHYVYTNTGISGPQLEALDSRFDQWGNQAGCDPATAPPDTNTREFNYTDADVQGWTTPGPQGQESATISPGTPLTTDTKGVIWSYTRPEVAPIPGRSPSGTYPTTGTPYTQVIRPPTVQPPGKPLRRVMNLAIVDCAAAGGICRPVQILGMGKFFLQKRTNGPTDKNIYLEFVEPVLRLPAEPGTIMLFK